MLRIHEGGALRAEITETVSVGTGDVPRLEVWSEEYRSENVVRSSLKPGNTFQVQLRVVGMSEFNGYDIMLGYDPKITVGSSVSFDGSIFGSQNLPLVVDLSTLGELRVAAVALGGLYGGDGVLATVTFAVAGTGGTTLNIHDDVIVRGSMEVSHNLRRRLPKQALARPPRRHQRGQEGSMFSMPQQSSQSTIRVSCTRTIFSGQISTMTGPWS